MSNWKTYKLEDIASKLGDGLHGTPKYDNNGEFIFVNGSNLVDGKIVITSNTKRVNTTEFNKHKKELNESTILLGINGTIGNVALYSNEKCILGKSACYINVGKNFDRSFIKYVLLNKHFQNYIKTNATGSTIKNVGLKTLREYEVLIPSSIETQRRIAEILSALDDKIEQNRRMNQTLEQMAQTLFRQYFVDGIDEENLPEGWQITEIQNLISVKDGTHNSPKPKEEGHHLITSKHIKGSDIDFSQAYFISEEDFVEINRRSKVDTFDILITMIGTVGVLHLVLEDKVNFAIKNIGLFKSSENQELFEYLYLYLKSNEIKDYLEARKTGSTQQYLTLGTLRTIPVILPSKEVLLDFKAKINPFIMRIRSNDKEIGRLIQLRDTLLSKLMSGEIDVMQIKPSALYEPVLS